MGEMVAGVRLNVGKHVVTVRSPEGHRSIAGVNVLRGKRPSPLVEQTM
jgi:hypothetical protein